MRLRIHFVFAIVFSALLFMGGRITLYSALPKAGANTTDKRVPVLVELFTSEGCSSCPPADALLMKLEQQQPVAGAEVIVLGQHVDYWDNLGWRDRFSSSHYTDRQGEYAAAFGNNQVYTPQMVIDGRREFTGSEENKALRTIAELAQKPKATVALSIKTDDSGNIQVRVNVSDLPTNGSGGKSQVYLAVTESGLTTDVHSGENGGHTLRHTGVVRKLAVIGSLEAKSGTEFSAETKLKIDGKWIQKNLKIVAFVQNVKDREIYGAIAIPLLP